MKLSVLLSILSVLCLQGTVASYPLPKYNKLDVICPPGSTSPSDCYPQVFVPTHEWQTVREGQDIPPGLHVRLNVYTNEKEAKLLDEEDSKNSGEEMHYVNDIVVVPEGESESYSDRVKTKNTNRHGRKYVPQLPGGDLGVSLQRIEEIVNLNQHTKDASTDLLYSLEVVSELSHDFDYGIQISEYIHPILEISGLANESKEDYSLDITSFKELEILQLASSIISSTMRNNPIAQRNVMSYYDFEFEKYLGLIMREIKRASVLNPSLSSKDRDLILKRYLNVLSVSFRMNYDLKDTFAILGAFDEVKGDDALMLLFSDPRIGEQVKETITLVLKDYQDSFENFQLSQNKHQVHIEKRSEETTEETGEDVQSEEEEEEEEEDNNYVTTFSKIAQQKLMKTSLVSDKTARQLLDNLARLKQESSHFKVDEEFLNWVYTQSELVKTHIIKRDLNPTESFEESDDNELNEDYHHKLLELRHEVFGNRFALRKAFADEL